MPRRSRFPPPAATPLKWRSPAGMIAGTRGSSDPPRWRSRGSGPTLEADAGTRPTCGRTGEEELMFEGLVVAMVTPFRRGAVDSDGTARLVDFMIDGGVEGLVVSGSTGEAATCTVEERRALWSFVKQRVRGRVPLIAGTGT